MPRTYRIDRVTAVYLDGREFTLVNVFHESADMTLDDRRAVGAAILTRRVKWFGSLPPGSIDTIECADVRRTY